MLLLNQFSNYSPGDGLEYISPIAYHIVIPTVLEYIGNHRHHVLNFEDLCRGTTIHSFLWSNKVLFLVVYILYAKLPVIFYNNADG